MPALENFAASSFTIVSDLRCNRGTLFERRIHAKH